MKTKLLSAVAFGALLLSSCEKNDPILYTTTSFEMEFSGATAEGVTVSSGDYTFKNVSSGEESKFAYDTKGITVVEGLYNITFLGEGSYNVEGYDMPVTLQGSATNVQLTGTETALELPIVVVEEDKVGSFVIKELFVAGTYKPDGKPYNGDQYFVIHNNSNKVLYADKLLFIESAFATSTSCDYSPLVTPEAVAVNMVLQMPGDGDDYPIKPGESFVIADNAINHKEANENSCDLSGAMFEHHFDNSTTSVDNPDVPNCENVLLASGKFWIPNKQGNKGYVIGYLPEGMTTEKFLEESYYEYKWTFNGKEYDKEGYKLPNEYVVDGVQLSPSTKFAWNVLAQTLDLGYTSLGETTTTKDNAGKSVIRKSDTAKTEAEGRLVLVDTNNSTNDFNAAVEASLLAK